MLRASYLAVAALPASERFELAPQIRRSAFSILSNIGEGAGRETQREYARFLDIAAGSAGELMAQAEGALAVGLGSETLFRDVMERATRVRKMLTALKNAIRRGE